MSYTKTQWRNNQSPAINADNLNHIEQGVYDAYQDITAETLARESTDNNLQAQIDQLVAPSGTAPNPAEIENARIGADGVTYDTLGNAIRTQLTDLKSEIVKGDVSIEQLRALLPTETVSSDMVSITDGQSVVPADSLSVSLSPIQDLNGYDKPWVGGAGKNKLPLRKAGSTQTANGLTATWLDDGIIRINGTATVNTAIFTSASNTEDNKIYLHSGTYIVSGMEDLADPNNAFVGVNINGTSGAYDATSDSTSVSNTFTVTEGDYVYVRIRIPRDTTLNNYICKPMIRLASVSDASFAPYSNICPISGRTEVKTIVSPTTSATDGRTYTTALGRTVYGGTLDVVSGVLTVDRASITFVGTETWSSSNNGMRLGRQLPSGAKPNSGNNTLVGAICSAFSERTLNQTWAGGASGIGFSIDTASTPYIYFCRTGNKDMTQANWNEYLASNPITVVYPLATPQTYQLTPQQIDLLLGTNHLWSDGEITLVYGADIQLWVEKKLQ